MIEHLPEVDDNAAPRCLTPAELSKTLVSVHSHGVISTIATDGGFPYGSVIDYLPLPQGDVVILLSEKAEHFRYLKANPKASLLVNAHLAEHESLYSPRITLLGEAQPAQAQQELFDQYLERHPDAAAYIQGKGLEFFQLDVSSVRYIAGAGRAAWVDAVEYRKADVDPLGEDADWLLHELNTDRHLDLINIAQHLLGAPWADFCRAVSVDRYGFDMICSGEDKRRALRASLDAPATSKQAFHAQLRRLAARARLHAE